MKQSWLMQGFARGLTRHPRLSLALLALVSVGLSFKLPSLSRDPSPRALLASADPEQEKLEAEARKAFGSTDNVVVIVLSGKHLLGREPLDYAHQVARSLSTQEHVERVDSITTLIWPKHVEEELTLDELEADAEPEKEASPAALSAAADLVAAAPDVFPEGLASLAARSADTKLERLVTGDHVSDQDVTAVIEAVQKAKQLTGRLISRDRQHLVIAAQFSDALSKHDELEGLVTGLETWLEKNPAPKGTEVTLSGLPVIRTSLVRHMRRDQRVLIPGTLIASLIVLALSFRWLPAVFLPVVAVAITALWLLGGMALFGEPLNVLNNILPALVIIIGLNEAVHIIGRYMEENERLSDKGRALYQTVVAMGAACLMTTLTSAIGMAALTVSRTEMLRRFGIVGAVGLLLAYVVTLLAVPAALALLRAPREKPPAEKRGLIDALIARGTTSALRNPYWVVGVCVVFSALCAYASSRVRVDSTLLDQFDKRDPASVSTLLLEKHFEGVRPLEVTLSSDKKGRFFEPDVLLSAHRVTEWFSHQPGVLRASDPTDPLASGFAALSGRNLGLSDALRSQAQVKAVSVLMRERDPRILSPVINAEGTQARIRVRLSDIGSHKTGLLVESARTQLTRHLGHFPDIAASFGGDAYMSSRALDAVVSDLSGSILVAALMIFLLLVTLLRDVRLAALAIPANLLPQIWTMAWMVMRGIPLNASSAIIFSLSIGLAVDGSIHVVSRFQEERAHGSLITTALVRAVRGTGRNIIVSSAALVLGFSVMLLSNFVPVQRFAELITVSMAGSVIATLVLQPVLLRFFAQRKHVPVPKAAPTVP